MKDDLQFDPYRFVASQNKLNFAKDELESFMAKVTESELFIMPKDMPCKILLNKHLKTLEKYPTNLNDWDIKMTDFKNMISTMDATFAEQLGVDNSAKNVTEELTDIESELVTLNEKYDEYMSKVTQYASRREAYPASEEDLAMLSRKRELEARQTEINETLHTEEDKWYEDIANAGKTLFKSAEDVVDSVLKGDKDSIVENSIDLGVQLKATEAVVDTSVVSGVGKIVEGILDGVGVVLTGVASIPTGILDGGMYLLSKAANIEFESATRKMWEQTMDDVARDKVGEINDSFYTDTLLGKTINDNSALKYDGAGAEAIQTGAKFVGEVALYTVSGGTLAPVLGGLEALGESAQNEYQKEDRRIFTARMGIETAGGVFKGIMYNRIGTNILKLGQLGVKQGIATVLNNAKASISSIGFKGLLKHAFWSKDAGIDALFTLGQKASEAWVQNDETGTINWEGIVSSTIREFLFGRISDTALGLASRDSWTYSKDDILFKQYYDDLAASQEYNEWKAYEDHVIDDKLTSIYSENEVLARNNESGKGIFEYYDSHTGKHISLVVEKTTANLIAFKEALIKSGNQQLADQLDLDTVIMAAKCHDVGMRPGGLYKGLDGEFVYISATEPMYKIKNGNVKVLSFQDAIREYHTLNSAIDTLEILKDSPFPYDAETIALEIFLHSKNNSGVRLLDSSDTISWESAIGNLEKAAKVKEIPFDSKKFYVDGDISNGLNIDLINKIAAEAFSLRIGDSTSGKVGISQGGNPLISDRVNNKAYFVDSRGEYLDIDDIISVGYINGEQNVAYSNTTVNENGQLQYVFTIKDEGVVKETIEYGIEDKIKEMISYDLWNKAKIGTNNTSQLVIVEVPENVFDQYLITKENKLMWDIRELYKEWGIEITVKKR